MQTFEGEKTNCPVCESPRSSTIFNVIQEDWKITTAKCLDCSHKYANPQPSASDLFRLYSQGLSRWTDEESYLKNRRRYFDYYSLLVRKLILDYHPINSILDIGCGTGLLAKLLSDRFDLKSGGIDISPADCSIAAQRLDEVICGNISSKDFITTSTCKYDLVIAMDVFEHLTDLNSAMGRIGRLTTAGGFLIIDTGDVGCIGARLGGNRNPFLQDKGHINYFSRKTMELLLQRNGYQVIEFHDECEVPGSKEVSLWIKIKRAITSSPNMIVIAQKVI